jgi:hypothetical protein
MNATTSIKPKIRNLNHLTVIGLKRRKRIPDLQRPISEYLHVLEATH